MERRTVLAAAGAAVAAGLAPIPGRAANAGVGEALERFKRLPGKVGYAIQGTGADQPWTYLLNERERMFVGSAIKTFILARFLKDVEEGRLTEDAQVPIDDRVRSLSSPTFLKLTGSVPARIVLEAMIAHSDNTATDAAMALVGHQRVRAFIAAAGLGATAIPRSTRTLFSYLAGAPAGKDLGWAGVQQVMQGKLAGKPRAPINDVETMLSTAEDFVSYYQRALAGKFFDRPETLREFKRIQAMADAIARVVPPDIVAYAKGGSIEWQDFYALCLPGQMILRSGEAVTFCFTLNWSGKEADWPAVAGECQASVAGVLSAAAKP